MNSLKAYPWIRGAVPLLAIPASGALSCPVFGVCDLRLLLVYQWPSWLACYLPYWAFLYFFKRSSEPRILHEVPGKGDPLVRAGMYGVNAIYSGVTIRFAATAAVLLYWKDAEIYKPVLTFLSHLACFFLFQLAAVLGMKK